MNFFIVKGRMMIGLMLAGAMLAGVSAFVLFMTDSDGIHVYSDSDDIYKINMVTGEFKSKTEDGKVIESYRWDPGTVYLPAGEPVTLSIFGVNGKEHPFIIEGTEVSGKVKKGEETVLNLQFDSPGVYRLICTAHASIEDNGPMIAYLVVK
ncbi:cupredoxin domain-containing protein [Salipaludibacillus sp. CUR1]|uniref:cupredoxin domain-containing protein n=1 Tax=Salipaludibacillus sp. CUR1 TaxID=2820003 RepID=UPI001E3652AB|nr:cupredoxin domain-containing protein [Salipaludibacillus sp. CUR1]MCE7791900.1 cupredoxin domain-containing protein [Salipaludibacillus sp. CUR1]